MLKKVFCCNVQLDILNKSTYAVSRGWLHCQPLLYILNSINILFLASKQNKNYRNEELFHLPKGK